MNCGVGILPAQLMKQIQKLYLPQLQELGGALLDFSDAADLVACLQALNSSCGMGI